MRFSVYALGLNSSWCPSFQGFWSYEIFWWGSLFWTRVADDWKFPKMNILKNFLLFRVLYFHLQIRHSYTTQKQTHRFLMFVPSWCQVECVWGPEPPFLLGLKYLIQCCIVSPIVFCFMAVLFGTEYLFTSESYYVRLYLCNDFI